MRYDPLAGPDSTAWLDLDEGERLMAVLQYHERAGMDGESVRAHAAIHTAVETQLAQGHEIAIDALRRLMADGLDRHDAIHAIGSLVAGEIYRAVTGKRSDESTYEQRLSRLTAADWLDSDKE